MKKKVATMLYAFVIVALMALPTSILAQQTQSTIFIKHSKEVYDLVHQRNVIAPTSDNDFDPLDENIIVTVTINEIRALKTIDLTSNPDFYVKVKINDNESISNVWQDTKYVEAPNWSVSSEVPKDKELVNITIELWDKNSNIDGLCDISPDSGNFSQARTAELIYSIAAGIWWGDDSKGIGDFQAYDLSGYGRLNGCDDNSIYQQDRDCELWFTITQTDFDGDGLPYWIEVNEYNTSPLVDNRGEDPDHDGLPIEYEHQWGCSYTEWHHGESGYYWIYDPFVWENHTALDPEQDGLNNIEEYKTSQWGSDPFRKDIFIEIDQMELGPNGEGAFVPTQAYDLLRDSYAKHNIVWHIDDGRLGGGERIPFKEIIENNDMNDWYWNYFMHGNASYWRRGVFRWCIISYNYTFAKGFTFGSNINGSYAIDCFFLSTKYHEMRAKIFPLIDGIHRRTFNREMNRAYVYAGGIMHETGHTSNIRAPGVDADKSIWPWQVNYWRFAPYKSCMHYRYIYRGVIDYSDGSHGKNDYDDWGTIDLTYFNPGRHW